MRERFEPERYELHSAPPYSFDLDRREFFKLLGGGIAIALLVRDVAAQEAGGKLRAEQAPRHIGAWLHIGEDGRVTVYTGKVEVGQDIRTSLAQVVAEELRLPISSINLVMGDTDLTPFDMGTFGSRTTPTMAPQLGKAAASARELLLELAADKLSADRSSLIISDGKVVDPGTKRWLSLAQLAGGQRLMKTISDDVPMRPPANWTVMGKSIPKVSARDIVTGKHRYASDIKLPGMLYGKVLRPPSLGAALISADTKGAEAMRGVRVVRDGDFIGVVAADELTAARALASIRAEWKTTEQPSSRDIFDYLKRNAVEGERFDRQSSGHGFPDGLAIADYRLQRTYTVAYIAHAPLEPRAAVAEWRDGKLTVWTGTQRPFGVRGELARAFRIPEEKVRVVVPDTGSGYGGKHTGEAAIEAARLARAAGRPVKVVWTRQEEFTWAYFRPAGVIDITSGVRKDGTITAWEFHNYNSGAAAIRTVYDIPNQDIRFHPSRSPLRQGSYRALAATANHFARETHMDELAHLVGIDPLEFRLKNLKDARMRAVLEAAAEAFGWGRQNPPADGGFGIAGGFEKGSYVATCAEVSIDRPSGKVKVVRAVTAFECGAIINPDNLRNQIEGSIIMGIGGALFEAIEFEGGKILNPKFSNYRVPRMSDVPALQTILIDRKDLPSAGAGETPIVAIAPAIGNAIFSATGLRLRSLPLAPGGLKPQLEGK